MDAGSKEKVSNKVQLFKINLFAVNLYITSCRDTLMRFLGAMLWERLAVEADLL
jgi:hypothetical protein